MSESEKKEVSPRWSQVLGYSVVAVVVLGLSIVIGSVVFLPLDQLVVEVTNEESYPLRNVRFPKFGKDGEVGLLRPGESKRIEVSKDSFQEGAQLRWVDSRGVDVSTGGMWETFSETKEKVYLLNIQSGSVSSGARRLTFRDSLEGRW